MANGEWRNNDNTQMIKSGVAIRSLFSAFVIWSSFVLRHSDFVICLVPPSVCAQPICFRPGREIAPSSTPVSQVFRYRS